MTASMGKPPPPPRPRPLPNPVEPGTRPRHRRKRGASREVEAQRADHFEFAFNQVAAGKCWASGLTLASCKASICDCSDFEWIRSDQADRVHFIDDEHWAGWCNSPIGVGTTNLGEVTCDACLHLYMTTSP
jgi:hypothetical protein